MLKPGSGTIIITAYIYLFFNFNQNFIYFYFFIYRIVSVDISPEWPKKRTIVAGSTDGVVKQWSFTEVNKYLKAKLDQSHDLHHNDNEVTPYFVNICSKWFMDLMFNVSCATDHEK